MSDDVLYIPGGTHIAVAAQQLCARARETGDLAVMEFNGTKLAALPSTTPEEILAAWDLTRGPKSKEEKPETVVPRQDLKYRHTLEMGEISGFGGGYEECCQVMLDAGVKWLDEHPGVELQFHGYKNVYGILNEDNEHARALTRAVIDASNGIPGGGATGAMHQAVVGRLLWIRAHSWAEYVKELEQRELKPEEKVDA